MLHTIILAGENHATQDATRRELPLQFEQAEGVKSLFRRTLSMVSGPAFSHPTVITTLGLANEAWSQMRQEQTSGSLLLEPEIHKPAAAVTAALMQLRHTPDALAIILPTSAASGDVKLVEESVAQAIPEAHNGKIAILANRVNAVGDLGVELNVETAQITQTPCRITRVATAGSFLGELLNAGHAMWSTGIIVARVGVLLAALKRHATRLYLSAKIALHRGCRVMDGILFDREAYNNVKPQHVEMALSDGVDNLVAVAMGKTISPVDEWEKDAQEDCVTSQDIARVHSDMPSRAAQTLNWLEGMSISHPSEGILNRECHEWGTRDTFDMGAGLVMRRIILLPGEKVTINASHHGAEHWIVAEGSAIVQIGHDIMVILKNQGTRVPTGGSRTLENPGSTPLHLIKMQMSTVHQPMQDITPSVEVA